MNPILLVEGAVVLIIGGVTGYVIRHYVAASRRGSIEAELEEKILQAKRDARSIEDEALTKASLLRDEMKRSEERIRKQEERLDIREQELIKRDTSLSDEIASLREKSKEMQVIKERIEEKEKGLRKELEKIASLSEKEAKDVLFSKIIKEGEEDIQSRLLKLTRDGEARFEEKAKDILVSSIYRIANGPISQFMTATVEIADEEIKGKVIGKEGRNIKSFERLSGVEVLVDEVPNGIVISCFDPVRRAIAKNALEMLIKDGRIQPAKIEECLEKAKKDIGVFMQKKGEEAVLVCGLLSVPPLLIPIIGRLYFRTSYGQNVLDHSIEMAHIAGVLASELGADVHVAKAGALLHDIGKAVDHEIQGTHVEIGRKILAKYGVDERVILAMQAHHEEYPYETVESVIVQVADAISGGRPGARRDTVDRYIKRLEDLEALAMSFTGIERVYALQAGREIRVFVSPLLVNDIEARNLARNIALRVEQELRFPGEIKIHVIRESRSIEFAR
ncbi:MAG: ribonuclease Y [Candidatus Pacebacteria bacterium]|nr:ribonuclease Y [Candidatus Paceibacterota bacterium]MBP9867006.1 ribonuclease Y [Candidatus Paceibacterota bacterium]